jgi:hypothetical protein
MQKLRRTYEEWRWATYLNIDIAHLQLVIEKPEFYKQSLYFNITEDQINDYLNERFSISKDRINEFDSKQNEQFLDSVKKSEGIINSHLIRSVFIENCYIDITGYSREKLLQKIRQNLIFFHWWDVLTLEELIKAIMKLHFLKSTNKLIDKERIFNYFKSTFYLKQNLIDKVFKNFNPDNSVLNRLNDEYAGHFIFDYNWLFSNDLKWSIRIVENECRLYYKERIIGAFYNEDILYTEINKSFGKKYKVVSQGSPEWLRPQRFDIYFPDLNIAIEYQGEQHFTPVDFGGKGVRHARKQFEDNVKRDMEKSDKAIRNNCLIIYAYPNYNIENIISEVKKAIQEKLNELH